MSHSHASQESNTAAPSAHFSGSKASASYPAVSGKEFIFINTSAVPDIAMNGAGVIQGVFVYAAAEGAIRPMQRQPGQAPLNFFRRIEANGVVVWCDPRNEQATRDAIANLSQAEIQNMLASGHMNAGDPQAAAPPPAQPPVPPPGPPQPEVAAPPQPDVAAPPQPDQPPQRPAPYVHPNPGPMLGSEAVGFINRVDLIRAFLGEIPNGVINDDENVRVCNDEFFNEFYVNQFTQSHGSREAALAWAMSVNGYNVRNGDFICLRASARWTDTIHEVLHHRTDAGFHDTMGRAFNEGTTEMFNQMVCLNHNLAVDASVYAAEVAFVRSIIAIAGIEAIAAAYFRGNYAPLRAAINARGAQANPSVTPTYDIWLDYVRRGNLIAPDSVTITSERMARDEGYASLDDKMAQEIARGLDTLLDDDEQAPPRGESRFAFARDDGQAD